MIPWSIPAMMNPPLSVRKRSGGPLPAKIFLLYGEEDFLIKEKLEELKRGIADHAFNLEQIDGSKPDKERIVAALQTSPLLGGEKLVIIKGADLGMAEWGELVPSLRAVPPSVTLVILAASVDKRSRIYKLLDEVGEAHEFKSFAPWEQDQLATWIVKRASLLGKKINYQAAVRLREVCGNTLYKLASEIEKLTTFVGERELITEKDVAALASPGEINAFALSDAVASKDLRRALSAFRLLCRNRGDLFQILPLLATQFRTMLQLKSVSGKGSDARRIAQTLGASPYFVRKCSEKAQFFQENELRRNLELLLETDLKLKSGEPPSSTFELLLVSLCGK
jgi:DNA polymerase-3 subunit delta